MQLGTLLSSFDDEAIVAETLLAMEDLPLMARIRTAAEQDGSEVGAWAYEAVGRFIISAKDEQWLGLVSGCARATDPGLAALRHMLEAMLNAEHPA